MKKLFSIVSLLAVVSFSFLPLVSHAQQTAPANSPRPTTFDFFIGTVTEEPTEKIDLEFGQFKVIQDVSIEVSEDGLATSTILPYEIIEGMPGTARLSTGDKVIVGRDSSDNRLFISDVYRLSWLVGLIALFLLLVFATAGLQGLRALGGLGISLLIIGGFMVPQLMAGSSPILIGAIGIFGIAVFSVFVAHGFKQRTAIAFTSIFATTFFALVLSLLVTKGMHLFGISSDAAFFLQNDPESALNLQGILVVGIIIGVLGVLDDITTAQAAVVEELKKANPALSIKELYLRGSSVGKEHIISLVNTLVLAYTGVSLPLILLFSQQNTPWWLIANSELVMEELVRMVIGSMALLIAVPLTTALAAWWFGREK